MLKIIGHRGARGLAPENTLASIDAGLTAGVDQIEVDVRVTKDGVAILNHDPYAHDTQGRPLRHILIHQHTLAELGKHRPDLTTLKAAIAHTNHRVTLIIEVKPKVAVEPVVQIVRSFLQQGWRADEFLFGSFSQDILKRLHTALPQIGLVVIGRVSGVRSTWRAKRLGTRHIFLWHRVVWWGFVRAMHRRGYKLYVYSLNDPRKAARWTKHGLYGAITDYPDRFRHKN